MDASGWSRGHVFRQQKRGKLITMKVGRATHYASESLPKEALAKLETLSQPSKEIVRHSEPACAPAPLFAAVATQGPGRRIALTPEAERQAMQRLHVLQPLLDFCAADKEGRAKYSALRYTTKTGDTLPVRTSNDLALYLCQANAAAKASPSTLWDWKKKYEADGLVGLARKIREDKGKSKWATQFPEAAKLVAATFMQPFATRQRAFDALIRDAARLGMGDADLPSYASVCDFLATLPSAPVVWSREGERAHSERMAPYLSRGYTDIAPNDIWVADTMLHDVLVRDDCFNMDNKAIRPQLTALMDLRSRKLVGYTWVLDGSSRSITTALIRAVKAYGPCKTFYCDNGKDFQKVGRFATPANGNALVNEDIEALERSGALRQLGIAVQFCIKYHPQSKPIERFFGTLHKKLDSHFRHYTTGNAYLKPDATVEAAAKHGKLLKMGTPELSPLMPASHFIRMAETWIEQDYNAKHLHSGRGMNDRTADSVFNEGYPLEARRSYTPEILDTLLWRREKRLVRNCAVTINNRRMIGATSFAVDVLYAANESEVLVHFDPNEPELAVITDLSGHKLDRAPDAVSNSLALKAACKEFMDMHQKQKRDNVPAKHYPTASFDEVRRSALNALKRGTAYVIDGPPGTEKTWSAKQIQCEVHEKKLGRFVYVYARVRHSPQSFLQECCRAAGLPCKGLIDQLLRKLQFFLASEPTLFWVDEAQHLDHAGLEVLRQLLDQAGFGVVLAGSHDLTQRLSHWQMEQWRSRVRKTIYMNGPTKAECRKIIRAEFGDNVPEAQCDSLIDPCYAQGNRVEMTDGKPKQKPFRYISARDFFFAIERAHESLKAVPTQQKAGAA